MYKREVLLPDVRDFSQLLEYLGEWDSFKTDGPSRFSGAPPAPRTREGGLGLNEVGPFCIIDLSQLGGPQHRSIAVRATDLVIEAVNGRIVTEDDRLTFDLIGHAHSGEVLVVLKHGYIIGDHWLAYIDPNTIPAYPYERRDAVYRQICDAIKENGQDPFVKHLARGEIEVRVITDRGHAPDFQRTLDPNLRATIHTDGSVTRVWADGTVSEEPAS